MIQSARNYSISELFDANKAVIYHVPRYQREYTWTRAEWEHLFDDIWENEPGYFLGSIICINQERDALAPSLLEVVDGQQRLTTVSLLFAALYKWLAQHESSLSEEDRMEMLSLKRSLVLKQDPQQMRVVPQVQGTNQDDYRAVLGDCGVLPFHFWPNWAGLRRVRKAYSYFQEELDSLSAKNGDSVKGVLALRDKLLQASMVKIEVANHADAYVLFESLNNRGVPLTAVDLIKNKLLARMEVLRPRDVDTTFSQWQMVLKDLGDDYSVQERFFRQYYNAFRADLRVKDAPLAKRSNLMFIYEQLIDKDADAFLAGIRRASHHYATLLLRASGEDNPQLKPLLRKLERIQGAPSYVLMLYLLVRREQLQLSHAHMERIIKALVTFFVRRNVTNVPPTYELDRFFMRIIDSLPNLIGDAVATEIVRQLAAATAPDELFRARLGGNLYEENSGATRFILCELAEHAMTRDTFVDLWRKDGKQFATTIEHIFPQGADIPLAWVHMMAGGDAEQAKRIQQAHVHRLGNLTLSGYNSKLGTLSFHEKRDRKDREGRSIGYRNNLALNTDLATAEGWSVEQIEARTQRLVEQAMALFCLKPE